MKVKNIILTAFSPDIFKALVYIVSLLGVCPLLGASVDPFLKLFHVYALVVIVFDLLTEKRILRNKGRLLLFIFGGCYLVTVINNSSLQNISAISNFCYLLAELGLIFSYGKDSKKIDRITGSILTTLISAANLVGIWMFFAKIHINIPKRGYIGIFVFENRLAGLFGNPNVLGMVCMGAICLSAILLLTSQRRWQKVYFGILCSINVLTLMLSNSRTQMYSVFFMAAVVAFMLNLRSGVSAKRVLMGCAATVLTVAIVFWGTILVQYGLSKLDVNYDYYLRYISEDNLYHPEDVEFKLEGIATEDGVMYYYEAGEKTYAGLIQIDGDYYYVNSSCQVVTGEYNISKTNGLMQEGTYQFDKAGKMILPDPEGEDNIKREVMTENGVMYYYENGEKTYGGLIKIDEAYYYADASGRIVIGEYQVTKTNGLLPASTYVFGEDGKMILDKNGIIAEDGAMYYYLDGKRTYAGLMMIGEDYYYVNPSGQVVTGTQHVSKTNDLLPEGTYDFGKDGKLIRAKNGIIRENDVLYYYENGEKTYAGLLQIDEDYYYVNAFCRVVTGECQVTKTNGLLPAGTYQFGKDGKMIRINPDQEDSPGEIIAENGALYYYEDGEKTYAGLIFMDGNYYYVNSSGQVVTGNYQITKTNDLLPAGTYEFDKDGRMILDKNGILTEDGVMYYYENGQKTYAGLLKIGEDYYYVNSSGRVVTGDYQITKTNDLLPVDAYTFGEDGRMMLAKDGIVPEDGALYYYVDGKKTYAGLMMIDEDYYYVNSSGQVATGTYQITKTNGLLPAGTYEFQEDGKMIRNQNGIVTENGVMYYYENGQKTYAGLMKIGEDYYYVNSSGQVVTGTYQITKTNGLMPVGSYEFDEEGKLIPVIADEDKDGIVAENGGLYYYVNGEKTYAGLIQIGKYYYYVNSYCEVVTGVYKITKTNGLLPSNTYEFGEDGRLIRLHTKQDEESKPAGDTSINRQESEGFNGRVELWMRGLELFKAKPLFGVGLDNHDNAFAELGLPALPVRGNLHNAYIDLLACCGLAGFACLVAFLLTMFMDVIGFFRYNDGKTWVLGAVMLASVAAFLMDGLMDSTLISSFYPTSVSFWYIASQFAGLLESEAKRTGRYREPILYRLTDKYLNRKNNR